MRVALPLALLVLALPTAAAESYVHGRLLPAEQTITLSPGGRASLDYDWTLAFENTTCSSPVEVGITFLVVESPSWVGESFQPFSTKGESPDSSGRTRLDVVVDDEGPPTVDGVAWVTLELNPYSVANCAPAPLRYEEGANLTIRVREESPPAPPQRPGGGGTPSPAVAGVLVAIALAAARADGFHRNRSPGRF